MDLGANEITTFRKVTLPLLAPAMLAAALLGFALSIDDFVITYFNGGSVTQTFPVFVWGIARVSVPPQVNVVASAIFLVAIAIALANVFWEYRSARRTRGAHMTAVESIDLQRAAKEHLWMHFTRMGGVRRRRRADHRPRRRVLPRGLERPALHRRARGALLGQHRLLVRRGDRPGGARADARAALLHELVVRASARDRARGRGGVARAGRPQPRLLLLGRLRGRRVGVEARAPVLRGAGREAGPRARDAGRARGRPGARGRPRRDRRVARRRRRGATRRSRATSPTTGRRSARSRSTASPRSARRSSRSSPRCGTSRTRTATTVRRTRRRRSSRGSSSTSSSRRSSPWGRRRCASCTWSRCRTPAAASRRPRATGAACARSATATTSCSRPTRSSPRSAASATGSAPSATTSGRTSSRARRASRRRTPRSARSIATDKVMEPFMGETSMFSHGITFGGHPVMCAIALKNIEIMKREGILEHVRANEDAFRVDARAAPRHPDRRRPARNGLLLGDRARQGQGHARDVLRRGVRDGSCAATSRMRSGTRG